MIAGTGSREAMGRNEVIVCGLLGLLSLALLSGGCIGPAEPIDTGTKPTILSVTFPASIVADGTPYPGTLRFSDPDGDVALVEFASGGFDTGSFAPQVAGQTTGVIDFTYWATKSGYYAVQVTLSDASGHVSAPSTFSFTAAPQIAYRVTAQLLYSEFDANPVAGDLKYKGKWLAVSGYVESISSSLGISVVLVGAPGDWFGVRCYFNDTEAASVALLGEGDYVTVAGECIGMLAFNVGLDDCYVE